MTTIWEFHERQRKMSLTTNIFNNVLQSSGFSAEERLAREALQNSVDAHRMDADYPVSVRIEKRYLSGEHKASLVNALQLDRELMRRSALFDLPPGNALETMGDPSDPLPVLIISDYHACGLTGQWDGTGPGDHFGRLVVNLGVDDKAQGSEISGGSFGFGKTVYGKASRVGIVAFYSVYQSQNEVVHARFMATGLFKPHDTGGKSYDGFAFLGLPDDGAPDEVLPIADDAAHEIARQCNMSVRSQSEYGTSILIIDCDLDMDSLRDAAERYWWPRLLRHELDVVFSNEGEEQIPRPKINPDVQPFIRSWHVLDSKNESPPESKVYSFNRISTERAGMKKPGLLACVALESETPFRNRVALVRGPGMVVDYLQVGSDSYPACVGVFKADDDVEKILTYSEPQMHNQWDENSDRLKRMYDVDGPRIVRSILSRVAKNFRDFQHLQEPPVPSGGVRPKELSKLLGRFLDTPGIAPVPVPPSAPRPVSIHVHEDRILDGDAILDIADITLQLKEEHNLETEEYVLEVYHEVLGDSAERVVERSLCSLEDDNGRLLAHGNPASVVVAVSRSAPLRLRAAATSAKSWLTRIKVAAERTT